eukprot:CAMPEP_0172480984 /NCGR_PEP_ID=MMETSP1066-20121228/6508_1 /TAXON_ID=671091 /ORGANISM="Coscinodiscus wailesii, Strain CCMP2513" /LENGTH=422 /DNA_ID=CAMNT_0013242843 /DNA_START=119 /DNA_END=1387 /DNA_ORIENTATION=-
MTDGTSVELGSHCVHGIVQNPIFTIVEDIGLSYVKDKETVNIYTTDPEFGGNGPDNAAGTVPYSQAKEMRNRYWSGRGQFRDYECKKRKKSANDDDFARESLRDVADRYLRKQKELTDSDRRFFELLFHTHVVADYASDPSDLSAKYWEYGNWTEGEDVYLTTYPDGGFSAAVDAYAAPIMSKIDLNSAVSSIDYDSSIISIQYKTNASSGDEEVVKELKARHVILTVPLGVLKSRAITFNPPLPTEKQNAINELGNGSLTKCILRWDDLDMFWPKDTEWLLKIANTTDEQNRWTEFFNPYGVNGGRPILVGFVAGSESARVEELADEEITDEVLASLRSMFGNVVPPPKEVIVSRWGRDEYSRGAYSYYKVGSSPRSRCELGKCLQQRLYFAGEATDVDNPQTVHGALASGQRCAYEILHG